VSLPETTVEFKVSVPVSFFFEVLKDAVVVPEKEVPPPEIITVPV
jgi:hypothetical protein